MTTSPRTDAFSFYTCTIASFLESTVAIYVENLEPFFGDDEEDDRWLREVWLPEEAEHGRLTHEYVLGIWPEFDWNCAYGAFLTRYTPRCAFTQLRPSSGLEALARCVTEAEATMMYRCIARYTSDPALRLLCQTLSTDEVRHYRYFRHLHHRYEAVERNSIFTRLQVLLNRTRLVRDEDLCLAFEAVNTAWRQPPPFVQCSYQTFLDQAAHVMKLHFPFEETKRMLFRPLRSGRLFEELAVSVLADAVGKQFLSHA
jgi:rubrerythrin